MRGFSFDDVSVVLQLFVDFLCGLTVYRVRGQAIRGETTSRRKKTWFIPPIVYLLCLIRALEFEMVEKSFPL